MVAIAGPVLLAPFRLGDRPSSVRVQDRRYHVRDMIAIFWFRFRFGRIAWLCPLAVALFAHDCLHVDGLSNAERRRPSCMHSAI